MEKDALKRDWKKGDYIYVLSFLSKKDGAKAYETTAKILSVDYEEESFWAALYTSTRHKYKFSDYGHIFFDKISDAIDAAEKIPKPKTKVYVKVGNRFYRMTVLAIGGMTMEDGYDMYMCFKTKNISIKEIGHTVFLTEEDAKNSENKK